MSKWKLQAKDVVVFVKQPIGVGGCFKGNSQGFIGSIGIVVCPYLMKVLTHDIDGICLIVCCSYDEIEYVGEL